ncbi:MAG: disulfide oxidoreductase [Candidatus Aenigmatarchaeota archaeon]|nr:MAG: disulfide oxidoreductase [Candidatus Aenigmarchaeota archaeon]
MITRKTRIGELIGNPEAVELLAEYGFHCLGCPVAAGETIEDAGRAHGLEEKQIDELVRQMNQKIKKREGK